MAWRPDISDVPLDRVPLIPPPPGVASNFDNPNSNERIIYGINATLMFIALILVATRLWMNIFKLKNPGWDDIFIVLGVAFAYWYSALNFHTARYARHQWDVPIAWYTAKYVRDSALQNIALPISLCFTKIAIFGLYLRLFGVNSFIRYMSYAGIVVTFSVYFPTIPLIARLCIPRAEEDWLYGSSDGCLDVLVWVMAQSAVVVALDIFIFILPLPTILKMKLTTRKKVGVVAIFATAIMGVVAACVALAFRIKLWKVGMDDTFWWASYTSIFSALEAYVAIIVSCMPSFAAFVKAYFGHLVKESKIDEPEIERGTFERI